jgi:hypothetical protein
MLDERTPRSQNFKYYQLQQHQQTLSICDVIPQPFFNFALRWTPRPPPPVERGSGGAEAADEADGGGAVESPGSVAAANVMYGPTSVVVAIAIDGQASEAVVLVRGCDV